MRTTEFRPHSICLVGGRGRMGRWLAPRLAGLGYQVRVLEADAAPREAAAAAACEVVLLAVPVEAVEEVMRSLGPHTRPGGLVTDVCSLKAAPLAAMLAHGRGAVCGAHPLFGPGAASARGQVVFLCPGRGEPQHRWLRGLWGALGARVVEIAPRDHDRLMAQVQSLRHLLLAALAAALAATGYDPASRRNLSGPWFDTLLELIAAQAAQPASLYAGLALANPHLAAPLRALYQGLGRALRCLEQGDRAGLEELLARAEHLAACLAPPAPRP